MLLALFACSFSVRSVRVAQEFTFELKREDQPGCFSLLGGEVVQVRYNGDAALEASVPRGAASDFVQLTAKCTEATRIGCQQLHDELLKNGELFVEFSMHQGLEAQRVFISAQNAALTVLEVGSEEVRLLNDDAAQVTCAYYEKANGQVIQGSKREIQLQRTETSFREVGDAGTLEKFLNKQIVITFCETATHTAIPVLRRYFEDTRAQQIAWYTSISALAALAVALGVGILVLCLKLRSKSASFKAHGPTFADQVKIEDQLFQDLRSMA